MGHQLSVEVKKEGDMFPDHLKSPGPKDLALEFQAAQKAQELQRRRAKFRRLLSLQHDILLRKQRTSSMPKLFRVRGVYRIAGYTVQLRAVAQGDLCFFSDVFDDRLFRPGATFEHKGSVFKIRKREEFHSPGRRGAIHVEFGISVRPVQGKSCNYVHPVVGDEV